MPNNLLILPLVAGFIFIRICYYTKYRAQSLEGYRLLLESGLIGLILLGASRLFVVWVKALPFGPTLQALWFQYAPMPYAGTAVGSVFLAIGIAAAANIPSWEGWRRAFVRRRLLPRMALRLPRYFALWRPAVRIRFYRTVGVFTPYFWAKPRNRRAEIKKRIALNWATRKQNNQLLLLLNDAAQKRYMIAVTLVSRKFYIGYVKTAPSLDPTDVYFRLYPVRSGYRDEVNLRYEMTTDYDPVQAARTEDPVFVIMPIGHVQVANPFDPEIYAQYFPRRSVIDPSQ